MPVPKLFSYRKQLEEGNVSDVYVYDDLPEKLRIQIVHIWRKAIGSYHVYSGMEFSNVIENNEAWEAIENIVAEEHGVFQLGDRQLRDVSKRCEGFLLRHRSVNETIDLVEVSFRYIDRIIRSLSDYRFQGLGISLSPSEAISYLNERFRRAGVGYQYESGYIVRVDSEFVHSEVVRPALRFLAQPGFEGPREEFLQAHAHYRGGENRDAITDANNAFESTLKVICERRGWQYPQGARVSELYRIVRSNGLLPDYLDKSFDQLLAVLTSGLPRVRNNEGAHGQGASAKETPGFVAAYALHLAASNILFLAEALCALES